MGRTARLRLAWVGLLAVAACAGPPDDAELARRAAASRPTWNNYPEDVKAQIGATPVAEWAGRLAEVRAARGGVTVVFDLTGPWARRNAAVPVLLQEPFGGVHRDSEARREGTRVVYAFALEPRDGVPPWVELQFPHGRRHVVLPSDGVWRAAPGAE